MILMHRDYPVADVDMIAGQPYLNRVFIPERMPIGTLDERKFLAEKNYRTGIEEELSHENVRIYQK